jgi:hypothetical protein
LPGVYDMGYGWVSPSPHLKTETDSVSKTLCFSVIWNSERWTKSVNLVIQSVIRHRQNPFRSDYVNVYATYAVPKSHNSTIIEALRRLTTNLSSY